MKGPPAPPTPPPPPPTQPPPPFVSRECACGVCNKQSDYNDYNIFDDEGRECCKCKNHAPKCFPAAARVSLENGKLVQMSELQIVDRVQTGEFWGKISK